VQFGWFTVPDACSVDVDYTHYVYYRVEYADMATRVVGLDAIQPIRC
jgi:hypothetical protein